MKIMYKCGWTTHNVFNLFWTAYKGGINQWSKVLKYGTRELSVCVNSLCMLPMTSSVRKNDQEKSIEFLLSLPRQSSSLTMQMTVNTSMEYFTWHGSNLNLVCICLSTVEDAAKYQWTSYSRGRQPFSCVTHNNSVSEYGSYPFVLTCSSFTCCS